MTGVRVDVHQAAPHLPHTVYGVPSLRFSVTHMCGLSSEPQFPMDAIFARSSDSRSSNASMRVGSL